MAPRLCTWCGPNREWNDIPGFTPHYEIVEKIAESRHAVVYKGYHRRRPDRLLILKVLKPAHVPDLKKSPFRQRIEHLRVLTDAGLITPIAFEVKEGTCLVWGSSPLWRPLRMCSRGTM